MEIIGVIIIVILAIFLNGLIAEVEDDSPGGFNIPDGKWTDSFKNPTKLQIFIWFLGLLIVGVIIYATISKQIV